MKAKHVKSCSYKQIHVIPTLGEDEREEVRKETGKKYSIGCEML